MSKDKKKTPAPVKVLRKYWSDVFKPRDPDELFKDMQKESDRTAVVVFASILEDTLKFVLAKRMRRFVNRGDDLEEVFGMNRPLGSFSAKIIMADHLELIESPTRLQLDIVREMRNACAHSQYPISFDTPELSEACMLLFKGDRFTNYDGQPATDMKDAFLQECMWLSMAILSGSREQTRQDYADEKN